MGAILSKVISWNAQAILDACAVEASYGHLLLLTADGALRGLDLDTKDSALFSTTNLADIPVTGEGGPFGRPCHRVHSSADGRYAAIVVDRGQTGVVVETQTGTPTMHLHGGDYLEGTVPFSACFLRFGERDVFVHRTAWNRLDAADPATGKSLTERVIAPYGPEGPMPEHYLDYFHGQLLPSPEGSMIYDDGWVWHPISIPRVWSVAKWLNSNPWESEDGDSIVDLAMRDDWTRPACWVDERHVAMWGPTEWSEDASEEVKCGPGLRIVDVTAPKASLGDWWPMEGVQNVSNLFSDGTRLYVASDAGTTAWDIESRVQVAEFPGFIARLICRSRRSLVAFGPDTIQEVALSF